MIVKPQPDRFSVTLFFKTFNRNIINPRPKKKFNWKRNIKAMPLKK